METGILPKLMSAGNIAAGVITLLIVADAIYGWETQRESLLSWMQILLAGLAMFALFGYRITEFTLGKDGITIKQKLAAAAALGAAEVSRSEGKTMDTESSDKRAQQIAHVVNDASQDKGLVGKSILWVDDIPSNNIYERQALEALGVKFSISESTEDALQQLDHASFNAIISDMGRPGDTRAGYTLLDALKQRGEHPPFVIYAGSNAARHKQETKDRGGWGTTNRPQELIGLILSALLSNGKS